MAADERQKVDSGEGGKCASQTKDRHAPGAAVGELSPQAQEDSGCHQPAGVGEEHAQVAEDNVPGAADELSRKDAQRWSWA